MSYTLNLNKLVQDLKGPHRREALMSEVHKLKTEIEKLSKQVKPQAKAQMKKLESRYKILLKTLSGAQTELDKEVKSTIALVKKTAQEAEKNLQNYKKLAVKQKAKIRTAFTTKKKATRPRKTSVKAASPKN